MRVLILERELAFKDRVRGEALVPWGVAEAHALGIYEPLVQRCGQELRWWDFSAQGLAVSRRDLIETTPARTGCLTFSHSAMQTVLLELMETGAPEAWYAGAELAGSLAEFEGADTWVDHPYRDGVVLVGDAAAASDPSFGQGLSLTLRDVRVLRDQLLLHDDWDSAAHAYAAEHDRYYNTLHRIEGWLTDLLYEIGPEADARRAQAFPRLAEEPDRDVDILALGPDQPSDEIARRRFFAED